MNIKGSFLNVQEKKKFFLGGLGSRGGEVGLGPEAMLVGIIHSTCTCNWVRSGYK